MSNGKPARAVILAAGLGTRLRPLTAELPKPMVPVCGRPIITTILDGLRLAGIREIYIVCGWHKEKLLPLRESYPEVQFIDNPDYEKANNISSIVCAGEHLQDALIVEGDLYFRNPEVFLYGWGAAYPAHGSRQRGPALLADGRLLVLDGGGRAAAARGCAGAL